MTQKNRTLGFLLIGLGLMLILSYYNVVQFDLFDLWPLILLYFGIKSEREYFQGHGGGNKLMTGAVRVFDS